MKKNIDLRKALISELERLFHIYSPVKGEEVLSRYVAHELTLVGCDVTRDDLGNIMAVRGEGRDLPLLNAHLDCWQGPSDRDYLSQVGYDLKADRFQLPGVQIGCDDKAGIGIILTLAKYTKLSFKISLTVQEEIGQIGMQEIPQQFFKEVIWALSLDRKYALDVITEYGGKATCSPSFLENLLSLAHEIEVPLKEASGSMADTYYLADYCPAVNLSVGYYKPHQSGDYLIVSETFRILNLVKTCLEQKYRLI